MQCGTGLPDSRLYPNDTLRAACGQTGFFTTDLQIVQLLARYENNRLSGLNKVKLVADELGGCYDTSAEACRQCRKACLDQIFGGP
jgi:hypothetical protein